MPQHVSAAKPRKRFVGSRSGTLSKAGTLNSQIPDDVLLDDRLNTAIKLLPANYSFEIHKTIHFIRRNNASMVALQMPEGLQMFACAIADIIERFTSALTVVLGDVTYGACCIDDYTAVALGCDMLVHYGHSCLGLEMIHKVPIDQTRIKTLYVFVEIAIDSAHLLQTVRLNLPSHRKLFHEQLRNPDCASLSCGISCEHLELRVPDECSETWGDMTSNEPQITRLALVSTIQFVTALHQLKEDLSVSFPASTGKDNQPVLCSTVGEVASYHPRSSKQKYEITIPQSKPLSPGEILGCTAPRLGEVDAILYLGDGRFHLESIMMANPTIPAFRYDPYSKRLSREYFNHSEMMSMRREAIEAARTSIHLSPQQSFMSLEDELIPVWGLILGTLGHQGNFNQLQAIAQQLDCFQQPIPYIQILLSELSPAKLSLFNHISTFVQTSCPRLSIDWGYAFQCPLLSPFETALVVGASLGQMNYMENKDIYPMDFYEVGSPWAIARLRGTL
ncbi:hypothetical protein AMATHDRAFT_3819 [Amanita thiersii Skay4041]|uniref:2-(3-amino-3-carboxypropyl)histidine synthase subunit 1 n=1 Tax=Amanita thiersii Skay4041 TaxID=703135 RepID=A0A2A9NMI4_9AGAR|nr:hypothetical protein AMATHDRAFT_3819 [Amanita thiersii Skay4041]